MDVRMNIFLTLIPFLLYVVVEDAEHLMIIIVLILDRTTSQV